MAEVLGRLVHVDAETACVREPGDLVGECPDDGQAIVLGDAHERARASQQMRTMELRAQRQTEGGSHPPAKRDKALEVVEPVRFVNDEPGEHEMIGRRPFEACVAALVNVHEVHAAPSGGHAKSETR